MVMPIYEYECQACWHRLEALQKMSDSPLTECPECGKSELQRLISAAAFRLKGGGWYETDFKSGGKKNLAGAGDKKGGESESAGGASKSEGASSKPATEKKSSGSGGG